jgi:hypothetical protein
MDSETDTPTRTRRLVRWLKDKIEKRRDERDDHDPWWVTLLLDVGRPVVAILILTMCAPGEHYLARMVGFGSLSWGMPGALTAYAGIAAVVATKRPKSAPGHRTAVAGALLSILAAMAAQPLAHLYQQHVWTLTPDGRVWMTIAVSCVPAAVFGHLLHMGASASKQRRTPARKPDKPARRTPDRKPEWLADNERTAARGGMSVSDLMSDDTPDAATWTPDTSAGHAPDKPAGQDRTPDIGTGSLAADVRSFLTRFPDATNEELYDAVHETRPDAPDNSIYRARVRFEKKIGKVS